MTIFESVHSVHTCAESDDFNTNLKNGKIDKKQ